MAPKWQHRTLTRAETLAECPMVKQEGLEAAHRYMDAQVDDSRLVLRLISRACAQAEQHAIIPAPKAC